jgi:hypothetical protein
MSPDVLKSYKKLLLPFFLLCITLAAHVAVAADPAVEGCDPKVIKAQQARAQAKVCADVAITNEMIDQPDSVLALTCFNKSASVAANKGGDIFSGNFKDDLADIIEPALKEFYKQFDNAEGKKNTKPSSSDTIVDYSSNASTLTSGDDAKCTAMDDLWKHADDAGINKKVPSSITDEDLKSDTPPKCKDDSDQDVDCGDDFKKAWEACAKKKVFSDYKTAADALKPPDVPDFSADDSSCKVLNTAGISTGSCPP